MAKTKQYEKKPIKLTDKYYLDSDSMNYILMEKKIYEKGSNIGDEYFLNVAFYGSIGQLYACLVDKSIKADLELLRDVGKISSLIDELRKVDLSELKK